MSESGRFVSGIDNGSIHLHRYDTHNEIAVSIDAEGITCGELRVGRSRTGSNPVVQWTDRDLHVLAHLILDNIPAPEVPEKDS